MILYYYNVVDVVFSSTYIVQQLVKSTQKGCGAE